MKTRLLALPAALLALTTAASAAMIDKPSPHDVPTTIDRLEAAVEAAGAAVIARVDHSGAAEGAGMELRPTQLLIFGNPKVGTPVMQAAQTMSVVVPLRVAAYEDVDGEVHVIYENMGDVAMTYGLDPESEAVQTVAGALDKLTDAAVAED